MTVGRNTAPCMPDTRAVHICKAQNMMISYGVLPRNTPVAKNNEGVYQDTFKESCSDCRKGRELFS